MLHIFNIIQDQPIENTVCPQVRLFVWTHHVNRSLKLVVIYKTVLNSAIVLTYSKINYCSK